jgi:hypothetical protein
MKIKTPVHHQCCTEARREAQEILERYGHLLENNVLIAGHAEDAIDGV